MLLLASGQTWARVSMADAVGSVGDVDLTASATTTGAVAMALALVHAAGLLARAGLPRAARPLAWVAALSGLALPVLVLLSRPEGMPQPDEVRTTGWWWVALVGAVLAAVGGVALLTAPARATTTALGSTARPTAAPDGQDPRRANLDAWRSLDQGHDPTA